MSALILMVLLGAQPCAPERCEAECLAGSSAACAAAANQLLAKEPLKSAALFQRACTAEDAAACAQLSLLYARGLPGLAPDATEARRLEGRACALRHAPSCVSLARQEEAQARSAGSAANATGALARSAAYLRIACDAKLVSACAGLARLLSTGAGLARDMAAAARLTRDACDAGDKAACRYLGWLLQEGLGLPRDERRGAELLKLQVERPLELPPACDDSPGIFAFKVAPEVELWVDGLWVGKGPLVTRLSAGEHMVLGVTAGRSVRQALRVSAGQRAEVELAWPVTLSLETKPAGANLTIDGSDRGRSPASVQLSPGAHEVTATLAGFEPMRRALQLVAGEARTEALTLTPLAAAPSKLTVDSVPPGASLVLDGTPVGVARWEGEATAGKHQLAVALAGFETDAREITVVAGKPTVVTVRLKPVAPERGPLTVTSVPSGAELAVDGKKVGRTPWSGVLVAGPHALQVTSPGYQPWDDAASAPGSVEATLVPLPTGFRLKLTPPIESPTVNVDGAACTPSEGVWPVAPGERVLDIVVPGFAPRRLTFKARPGRIAELMARLTPAPVAKAPPPPVPEAKQGVRVNSTPPGAEIWVDESKVGVTPLEVPLAAGAHTVRARLSGYVSAEAPIEVAVGRTSEQAFVLRRATVGVAIESEPPGAAVYVDGEYKGLTPVMTLLEPASHRVYLTHGGFAPLDETRVVEGEQPRWVFQLAPVAPPPPPPPLLATAAQATTSATPTREELAALLADEKRNVTEKADALSSLRGTALLEVLQFVAPAGQREALCARLATQAGQARLKATALDSFGNEVAARLHVDGVDLAPLPFDGLVTRCATRFEAVNEGTKVAWSNPAKQLNDTRLTEAELRFPGRKRRVAISTFGELHGTPLLDPSDLSLAFADLQMINPGFGLRVDLWGQLFHFSVAVKGSRLFRRSIFSDPSAVLSLLADLHFGLTASAGSDTVRYRFAFDVGALSLVCPGVRLVHSLAFGETFFLTLTLDGAYVPDVFVPQLIAGTSLDKLWLLGGTFGLGFGF